MLFKTDSLKKLISPHQRKAISLETSVIYVRTLVWALKFEIDPDDKTVSSFSRFLLSTFANPQEIQRAGFELRHLRSRKNTL